MQVQLAHTVGLFTLLLTSCVGCGCNKTAPASTTPAPAAPERVSPAQAARVDPRGTCGGLASLALDGSTRLLEDRIRLRLPRGTPQGELPVGELATDIPISRLERATLAYGEATFSITALELHRGARESLAEEAVLRAAPQGSSVVALPGAPAGVIAVELPRVPDESEMRRVQLLRAYVRTQDALVVEVSFETTEPVAELGGCDTLARTLAAGLSPGHRSLTRVSGPRSLTGDLGITLPEDHAITLEHGEDFGLVRIVPLAPLGAPSASLTLYRGGFGELEHPSDATSRSVRLLGRSVRWWTWRDEEGPHREALVPMGEWAIHLRIEGEDGAAFDALTAVAASLTNAPPARVMPACAPSAAAVLSRARTVTSADVTLLAGSRRFARARVTLGEPSVPEPAAFSRLLASEDAADAFLHLVARGSTAGKLYGLAGLALLDRGRLEGAYCAVRDSLDEDVPVVDLCGSRTERAKNLAFSADPRVVTGEQHFGPDEWGIAADNRPVDIYGGGIGYALAHGLPGEASLEVAVRQLGGRGGGAATPASESPARGVAPRPDEALRVFAGARDGGLCVVRTDGRVGCWGGVRTPEGIELAPDLVRHPEVYVRGPLSCMLDAARQRVCTHDALEAREVFVEACGPIPATVRVERHTDGPFRTLFGNIADLCGVHEDGRLLCFEGDTGEDDDPVGTMRRIEIPDRVVGASPHPYGLLYAFTEDGRVFAVDEAQARHVGTFPGIVAIDARYTRVFLTLRDGRVLHAAYAAGSGRPGALPYYGSDWGDGVFREAPELRGARIFATATHACALFPDGRVSCFGEGDNGERGPATQEETPRDVPELFGADTLLVQYGTTCGRFGAERLVCLGWNVSALAFASVPRSARGPMSIDLTRVNQAPVPASPQNQSSASDRASTGGR